MTLAVAVGMTEEMRRGRARLKSCAYTGRGRPHGKKGTMYRAPTGDSGGESQNQHPHPCMTHNLQGWGTHAGKKIEGAIAVRLLRPLN